MRKYKPLTTKRIMELEWEIDRGQGMSQREAMGLVLTVWKFKKLAAEYKRQLAGGR